MRHRPIWRVLCLTLPCAISKQSADPPPFWQAQYDRKWRPTPPNRSQTYRDADAMACAAACLERGHGMVFLKHLRKAGGTSLRLFIGGKVCKSREAWHGHAVVDEGYPVLPEMLAVRTPTIFITCLRDPIERIISSYWFEGRTPIGGMETVRDPKTGQRRHQRAKPKSLAEFIEWTQSPKERQRRISTKRCFGLVETPHGPPQMAVLGQVLEV